MWIVNNISPSWFNVLSDLAGQAVVAVLLFALGAAYPYLVWESVKRGQPVHPNGVIAPPQSLLDALLRFHQDRSWLFAGLAILLVVATFSHPLADIFLDFVQVEVASNNTYFLGSSSGGLPTYSLLGDQIVTVVTFPTPTRTHFIMQADSIAQGISRFSILPAGVVHPPNGTGLASDSVSAFRSNLALDELTVGAPPPGHPPLVFLHEDSVAQQQAAARPVPGDLQVQCEPPEENIVLESVLLPIQGSVSEIFERPFPVCDYEATSSHKTIEKFPNEEGWSVLDWSLFQNGPAYDQSFPIDAAVGIRDFEGNIQRNIDFTYNETEWAIKRDDWQYGRRVRDGLSFVLGLRASGNETHWMFDEPYLKHPEGVEFQVEYSVVTGSTPFVDHYFYTLSSWSHNCPAWDSAGNLKVSTFPAVEESGASGCLIDAILQCYELLPQDSFPFYSNTTEYSTCFVFGLSATLLRGIEIDPVMLAAYAGIATRNKGINTGDFLNNHPFALNSIAAAYVMTREIVPGTVAIEGVRASIGIWFICFLILPLVLAVPLLALTLAAFLKPESTPPVPQSVWDAIVLGRGEKKAVPKRHGSGSAYDSCPPDIKYGIIEDPGEYDHLGLGEQFFIPLVRPLCEKASDKDDSDSATEVSC